MKRSRSNLTPRLRVNTSTAGLFLALLAASLIIFSLGRFSVRFSQSGSAVGAKAVWGASPGKIDTLVVYTYANRDFENPRNLAFFLKFGVKEGDGADYVVILHQGDHPLDAPPIPPNVLKLIRQGECYSWGAFGWLLSSGAVDVKRYKFFVLVDSSVRGPFIPAYIPASIPWHRLLTRRIDSSVKLVGPVISCEGAPFKGQTHSKWRENPSVQSYAIALDQEALKVLRRDPEITQCYWDRWDSIWFGELGATSAILNAGYNIDSFIQRFQGVNWRDKASWECNQRMNPTGEKWLDGYTLSPFEIMFVKVKDHLLHSTNSLSLTAAKYSEWMDGLTARTTDIVTNQFIERPEVYKAPFLAMMKARSPQCFDHGYYRDSNWDFQGWTDEQLWHNFIHSGQFEARPHRWMCEWETPPELLDEMDRYHEQRHPRVKRTRNAATIEAASSARTQEREKLSSEIELIRLRSAIV